MMQEKSTLSGILPVRKPVGVSSYDVVRQFKLKSSFEGKVGHGGSLDPFAEGLLLLLLGSATKKFAEIQKWQKVYRATVMMGYRSETLDITGELKQQQACPQPTLEEVEFEARSLVGGYEQQVPRYAAAKHKGVPLYKLARAGKNIPIKTKWVEIYHVSVKRYRFPELEFEADVGSGTYIRQLSYDWLKKLGVESYLKKLVRLSIGKIELDQAIEVSDFGDQSWQTRLVSINESE